MILKDKMFKSKIKTNQISCRNKFTKLKKAKNTFRLNLMTIHILVSGESVKT